MKNNGKSKASTIELVVILAVILILAAILIPTFISLVQQSMFYVDRQEVQDMNSVLSREEKKNGAPEDLAGVIDVLENAGYNATGWVCSTAGLDLYWYEEDNCLVLYDSRNSEVIYPKDYKETILKDNSKFHLLNVNGQNVIADDIALGLDAEHAKVGVGLDQAIDEGAFNGLTLGTNEIKAFNGVKAAIAADQRLCDVLDVEQGKVIFVYGSEAFRSNKVYGTYAYMQVMAVGQSDSAEQFKADGNVKENVFYIAVNISETATADEISAANLAAGSYLQSVFAQINEGKVSDNVAIILAPGTTLDVSAEKWAPVAGFSGFFGSADAANPAVIRGAVIDKSLGCAQAVNFIKDNEVYTLSGFIGSVYGTTTVENITFKDMKITAPATDFDFDSLKKAGLDAKDANTVGVIGGITDNGCGKAADVVISNVTAEASVEITGSVNVGGLAGYIGSTVPGLKLTGNVKINGCKLNGASKAGENGACGGIIGIADNGKAGIDLKDCVYVGNDIGDTVDQAE